MTPDKFIDIYKNASKFFYSIDENLNQKSIHWKKFFDSKKFNKENLINFRNSNSKLSTGLDDHHDTFSFKLYSEIISLTSEEFVLNNLTKKNIGNSDSLIPYKEVLVDYNKLIHIYWFWIMENKVFKNNKVSSICEIGGGFGSFIELFIRNYNSKAFLIDLPEANLLSSYYLKELFPEKNFFLFDDYKKTEFLSHSDFEKNDIIILPPNCNIDKKIKIDFFINTRSMMEMNFKVIESYFKFIHHFTREGGYFLNVNRYEKTHVGEPIRISEYPYDNYWKTIISDTSRYQKWHHFLLTKRISQNQEGDIKQQLEDIKKISKKFYIHPIYSNPYFTFVKKILKRVLKLLYLNKLLYLFGSFLFQIGRKLKNFTS